MRTINNTAGENTPHICVDNFGYKCFGDTFPFSTCFLFVLNEKESYFSIALAL